MKKIEKLILAAMEQDAPRVTNATNWAIGAVTGPWTNDKLMRRIYAIIDLAAAGAIVEHVYDSTYHAKTFSCRECRNEREESTLVYEVVDTISHNETEG